MFQHSLHELYSPSFSRKALSPNFDDSLWFSGENHLCSYAENLHKIRNWFVSFEMYILYYKVNFQLNVVLSTIFNLNGYFFNLLSVYSRYMKHKIWTLLFITLIISSSENRSCFVFIFSVEIYMLLFSFNGYCVDLFYSARVV